jgi:hypothetical protein
MRVPECVYACACAYYDACMRVLLVCVCVLGYVVFMLYVCVTMHVNKGGRVAVKVGVRLGVKVGGFVGVKKGGKSNTKRNQNEEGGVG